MKTMYLDMTDSDNSCMGVFIRDVKIIPAGTTVYSMQVKDKNDEYAAIADKYDIHFIFDDYIPNIDFYSVPHMDIMAVDSKGGFLGTLGEVSDLDSNAPICYIDNNRKCFLIASSLKELLNNLDSWQEKSVPCEDITIFTSKEEAVKQFDFIEPGKFTSS